MSLSRINFKSAALAIMGITFIFQMSVEWLQMKSAKRAVPGNVKDVYDGEAYQKWLQYYREKTRLSFFHRLTACVVPFAVVGFDIFAVIAGSLPLKNSYAAAAAILAADVLISLAVDAPFSYAGSMVVEQRYGFNRMTKKTSFLDLLKNTLIELAVLCGLCCLFIWLHTRLGNLMIPVFTGIVFLLLLLMLFLYPVFSRIFNRFEPLPEGELRDCLCGLLKENGCAVGEIKVMDGSRRSTKANAYFSGIGRTKSIVLYDTLLEQLAPKEIVAKLRICLLSSGNRVPFLPVALPGPLFQCAVPPL